MKDKENPVILVYRRTHTGDPNKNGVFGCHDCMGVVRNYPYNAVIGIGGSKPDPGYGGIKERVTWIGICPNRANPTNEDRDLMKLENPKFNDFGGQLVTFKRFLLLDNDGPLVHDISPKLYKYMFENHRIPRFAKNFSPEIYDELKNILKLADHAPPSSNKDISYKSDSAKSKCSLSNVANKNRGCG